MLAQVLENHVDEMDRLEKEFQVEIDKALASIDIDAVMANPKATLEEVTDMIKKKFEDRYLDKILTQGRRLAERIQEKDLLVDLSKNSDKNDD